MGLRTKIKKFLYKKKFKDKNFVLNIQNKNILITGSTSGIGLALTKRLLELGNNVFAIFRKDQTNLDQLENENLYKVKCDLSDFDNYDEINKIINGNRIDIIFNCAGTMGPSFDNQEIKKINFEIFNEVIKTNALSIVKILQILISKEKTLPKLIVNISSDFGSISKNSQGNAYIYRTSKTALNSITKNMSVDLFNSHGTVVFAIEPGNVKTRMNTGGIIDSIHCANLIIDLVSNKDVITLNGKFLNLNKEEIMW